MQKARGHQESSLGIFAIQLGRMGLALYDNSPVDDFQGVNKLLLAGCEALICANSASKHSVASVGRLLQHVQRHPLWRHLRQSKPLITQILSCAGMLALAFLWIQCSC